MMFLESNSFENSNFDPNIFQHHVTFRNLSEGKGTVRLNSGHPLRYQKLPKIKEEDIAKNIPGEYAACGFEVLLTRKHEPLVYQVNHLTIISTAGALRDALKIRHYLGIFPKRRTPPPPLLGTPYPKKNLVFILHFRP